MTAQKPTIRNWTTSDTEKVIALGAAQARDHFHVFRRMIRPGILWGWWIEDVVCQLQRFYEDLVAGKRPRLALMAPPQHGKSWAATDFVAWVAGKNPDLKTIFASYSAELGIRTNLDLQRIMTGPNYRTIFFKTKIGAQGWQCNTELIEFAGYQGSFRNTTVLGAINGMELHLGVIDDPVKGHAEAHSRLVRDRTWNWFADDYLSRLSKDSALLIIMTRWHVDDLLGRFIERSGGDVKVLDYSAIATRDEEYRKKGEALFPEHKPLDFLLARKKIMSIGSWESEYQQNPIIIGGGIFPIEKPQTLKFWVRTGITKSVRYWDKAGTSDGGAHTAGVLMHKMSNDTFVIEHVVRGQWSALERERKIKSWAEQDQIGLQNYEIGVEQEPGSGGKESAEATIRMLAGWRCYADKVTGSKEIRAEPFAAQVQGGNVWLVAGDWHYDFLDELESFPNGRYMDQADAASGAFNRLTSKPTLNYDSMS